MYLHIVIAIWLYATALTFHCEIMYCVCTGRATQLVKGAVVIDQVADSKLYTHYSVLYSWSLQKKQLQQ